MVFRIRHPPAHSMQRSFLCKWKVLRWYICHASFIYIWRVIFKFSYFKRFFSSWKYHFRLFLGDFLDVTPWNLVKMVSDLDQLCNASWCIRHVTFIILFLKKNWNWAKKKQSFGFFQRFFDHTLLRPMSDTPVFCQMKDLMRIHNRGKFHVYSICGCKVINFKMFLWQCSIHELGHFGGFWALNAPNFVQFCWNFPQR